MQVETAVSVVVAFAAAMKGAAALIKAVAVMRHKQHRMRKG